MGALPTPKPSQLVKGAQVIKESIDSMIMKMQNDTKFLPTRTQMDEFAQKILDYIDNNYEQTAPYLSYLKAAVIDLTEAPEMQPPQAQRFSFFAALKDASHEIELYLSCL